MVKDAVADSDELTAYKALRTAFAARLAVKDGAPGAPSPELRTKATLLLAQADAQAGQGAPTPEQQLAIGAYPGGFDQLLRDTCQLSSAEFGSIALPAELLRLSNVVASA